MNDAAAALALPEDFDPARDAHPLIVQAIAKTFSEIPNGFKWEVHLGDERDGSEDYATASFLIEVLGATVDISISCGGAEEITLSEDGTVVAHNDFAEALTSIAYDAAQECEEARHEKNVEDWAHEQDEAEEARLRLQWQGRGW